jgi:uncharacterized protein (DUF302 family)
MEVMEDLEFIISDHNFRLTEQNRIGEAIARRDKREFPRANVVHFCNLQYAKKLLEIDPQYILHMPCRIAVREHSHRVVIEAWLLPRNDSRVEKIAGEINAILKAMVKYAAD